MSYVVRATIRYSISKRIEVDESRIIALYVPDDARVVLEQILDDYAHGELTGSGKPQKNNIVAPIEAIRQARLETFWTDDPDALPQSGQDQIWWELWCVRGAEPKVDALVETLGARVAPSDHRLYFPESTVIPVLASRATIELMLFATFTIKSGGRGTGS